MAFKRRSTLASAVQAALEPEAPKAAPAMPLHIEAKPKQPVPEQSALRAVYGPSVTPSQVRRLGPLALDCGDDMRRAFTIADLFAFLRTPFDTKSTQEVRYRNRIKNRGTAITANCIVCQGTRKAVTECMAVDCPLWAFRLGNDPFFGRRK